MTKEQLLAKYPSGPITFGAGEGGLPCITVRTSLAKARVYLHGAHVAHFQPAGQKPVIFISRKSFYQSDKPIRGGVPICYPWFGPKADDPTAPMHGVARLQEWTVDSVDTLKSGEVEIVLSLTDNDLSRKYWPYSFRVEQHIRIGRELSMTLVTTNTDSRPFTINEALHSYFSVRDVRKVSVTGLENTLHMDKTRNMERFTESAKPITITSETDRHYLNTATTVTIHDQALGRRIVISKTNSQTTVVWNPWVEKAIAMPDFGDEEWTDMICVETANAADNAVTVAPGARHEMTATIRVE